MDKLRLAPLERRRFQDFEHLMSGKEFGGCYCALWTSHGPDWEARCGERPQENLEHTRQRIQRREHVGFLVIRESDGAVVGWTGTGPKPGFPFLKERPASRKGANNDSVWSIACLALGRSYRGLGYSKQIVELLVEEAKRAGAKSLEAYPRDPANDDSAYRGHRALYESLGFAVADQEQVDNDAALRMEKSLAA